MENAELYTCRVYDALLIPGFSSLWHNGRLGLFSLFAERDPSVLMISLQVFYEGSVQGVGFRWSVRHIATGFDVTGWVRNLHDGRVEMQVAGEDTEVFSFLDAIKTSELASHIRRQQETRLESRPDTRGFEIRQ